MSAKRLHWTEMDLHLFNEGSHFRLYEKMGAHVDPDGAGVNFSVWAPSASAVAVAGDFNGWNRRSHQLSPIGSSGIWEGTVAEAAPGHTYKYYITARHARGRVTEKADPFAFEAEVPPKTASRIRAGGFAWSDDEWMRRRGALQALRSPVSIYEVHLGSWMRVPGNGNRSLTYREIAPKLAEYVLSTGFTHVEFLPVMEHPFYGSWGYQTTGYFAPTSRYGTPDDFAHLIDHLHRTGIGVILDWVPSHFPGDGHGLATFDGTHLYEHADPKEGFHPDWKSWIFNYGRHEVRSFLISNACFWFDRYHVDGLRVDAVASMLYRDYSRKEGEWVPNVYGGRENLEAMGFLRRLNQEVYGAFPGVQMMAEESTAWPMVSRPTYLGGLGFGLKWDMGWMHDTLKYLRKDPVHRKYHQNEITFRGLYAFTENFILPLSHDEVVHEKGALLRQMPGDTWQKFAGLRQLYAYMFAQPGKKLLFMGGEFGQWDEWDHNQSLQWHLLEHAPHRGVQHLIGDLNRLYRTEAALHTGDCVSDGFEWVDCTDEHQSVIAFLRKSVPAASGGETVLVVCNFTPVPRGEYHLGVPESGTWSEILNSDSAIYGGSGVGNLGGVRSTGNAHHGRPDSIRIILPPLGVLFFKHVKAQPAPGAARK